MRRILIAVALLAAPVAQAQPYWGYQQPPPIYWEPPPPPYYRHGPPPGYFAPRLPPTTQSRSLPPPAPPGYGYDWLCRGNSCNWELRPVW
jgi:hypothetical protein